MQFIDIGINLMSNQFNEDRHEIVQNASKVSISPMIITGCNLSDSTNASIFAAKYNGQLYSTAGIHPHNAKSCDDTTISKLEKLCNLPQVVAVGECGLDYDRDFSPRDIQRKWFEAQIELAKDKKMPLFLHERAAFDDFYNILTKHDKIGSNSVVHCFTGTKKELEAYLSLGCYIGITGWICDERRGLHLRELIKLIPDNKLMIETDAPYLMPRNLKPRPKSHRNEPAYLVHIAREIAELKGVTVEELSNITVSNTKKFFNLS
jgi:hydrolase, TatD family